MTADNFEDDISGFSRIQIIPIEDKYKAKTIIKISISEEFWKLQERRKIMDYSRIADQAAKLKNKKNSS